MRRHTRLIEYGTSLCIQSHSEYDGEGFAFPLAELRRWAGKGKGVEVNNAENERGIIRQAVLETDPCPQGAQVIPEVRDACRLDPREDGLSSGDAGTSRFFLRLWYLPRRRSVELAVTQAQDRRVGGEPAQERSRGRTYQWGDVSALHRDKVFTDEAAGLADPM